MSISSAPRSAAGVGLPSAPGGAAGVGLSSVPRGAAGEARAVPGEPGVSSLTTAELVEARIWEALRHVEDPEIPVSVIGMGLIVSVAYNADDRAAELEITFTAMGCPATDFIEDDIREALLADPAIDEVRLEVVWDPIWTKDRIRAEARATMRELGILV